MAELPVFAVSPRTAVSMGKTHQTSILGPIGSHDHHDSDVPASIRWNVINIKATRP